MNMNTDTKVISDIRYLTASILGLSDIGIDSYQNKRFLVQQNFVQYRTKLANIGRRI